MNLLLTSLLLILGWASAGWAQSVSTGAEPSAEGAKTLLVLPFENSSKAPGLEWIGEAFPELLGPRMASPRLYVLPREDRVYAFDRSGIPAALRPSRATLFRIAESMEVDYVVLGNFTFDGREFTATAQLLDVKQLHLSPAMSESGPLVQLLNIQSALAWDLLRRLDPQFDVPRENFVSTLPSVRLDALENYVRGITASARPEKIRRLREAVRLDPSYTEAMLQLGHAYFEAREYESAASWYARVPRTDALAKEASFYAGLSYYYLGQFERADNAFTFLLSRLPLTEVYNNLGVVAARRGKRSAIAYFQKAVAADPADPDYRFNLAVALYRGGDPASAARQLREALSLHPSDSEAKALLDSVGTLPPAGAPVHLPLERIKVNYEEAPFRQLALEIQNTVEVRLSQTDPKSQAAYHVARGQDLLARGFRGEAGPEFREAVTLDPTNAAAHAGLADVLEAGDQTGVARNEADTALRLQPSAEAYLVRARLDLRDNKPEAAAESVNRALALEPDNTAAQDLQRAVAAKLAQKAPPLPPR